MLSTRTIGRAADLDADRTTRFPRLAAGVAFVAFALYLLSFGGVFHNAADEWIMFALTESLAKRGDARIDQLYWVGEYMGWARFGVDGHLYVKYTTFSTGQSILGVAAYTFGRLVPGAGLAQAALLTNSAVVAATLALLVLFLGELRFSTRVALTTAALFGTGSILWPYAGTYFGEPLLGLAFLACFYCLIRYARERGGRRDGRLWIGATGCAWAVAVLAKPTGLLIGPFALGMLFALTRGEARGRRVQAALIATLPTAVVLAAVAATSTARFGLGEGYAHANSFSTPLLTGLWGLLLSPGRSFFVYSPVAVLALPGLYFLWRGHRPLAAALIAFSATYLLFFALWSDWYGGRTNWGPRHLVPLVPLLAVGVAALLDAHERRGRVWAMAGGLWLAGLAVQVPAVANDYLPVMLDLIERHPAPIPEEAPAAARAFGSVRLSPVVLAWRWLAVERTDLAWLRGPDGLDGIALGLSIGLLALAAAYLAGIWRRQRLCLSPLAPLIVVAALVLGTATLLPRYAGHLRYGPPEYRQAVEHFDREAGPGAALITLDTESHRAFNYQRRASPRYGLPGGTWEKLPAEVVDLLDEALRSHDEVWLLATGDEVGSVERLARTRRLVTEEWRWGDHRLVRLGIGAVGLAGDGALESSSASTGRWQWPSLA